jgi:hypothetical protein
MCPCARRGEACPNGDTCGKVRGRAGQRARAAAGLLHWGPDYTPWAGCPAVRTADASALPAPRRPLLLHISVPFCNPQLPL